MRDYEKRTERIHLRVTPTTRKKLEDTARKSKRSLSRTVEQLVLEHPIREVPPLPYFEMLEEMRRLAKDFNQLVTLANLNGDVNQAKYARMAEDISKAVFEIKTRFILR